MITFGFLLSSLGKLRNQPKARGARKFYDFRVPKMLYYSKQAPHDRTGHLAYDKLALRLVEIVYRDLEIELEGNGE